MNEITLLKRDITTLKQQQAESVRLLNICKTQMGMVFGEDIEAHIALLTGTKFSSIDYHFERFGGEQGV